MKKFKKIFVAGTFDRFHLGHQFLLWSAAGMCEEMVVVIARDETVEKIKKRKPTYTESARLKRLKEEGIEHATIRLGREDGDRYVTLREEDPDVLFLGYDQRVDIDDIRESFPELEIIICPEYFPEFFKSSLF